MKESPTNSSLDCLFNETIPSSGSNDVKVKWLNKERKDLILVQQ